MLPSDLPEFCLVEGIWIDRRIPNCQVPRPNQIFWDTFYLLKNEFLLITIYNGTCYGTLYNFGGQLMVPPTGGTANH